MGEQNPFEAFLEAACQYLPILATGAVVQVESKLKVFPSMWTVLPQLPAVS